MLINVVVRFLLPIPDQRYASQWNPRISISSPVILLPPRSRRSHHRVVTRKEIPEFVFELCQVRIQSLFSSTPSLHSIPLVTKKTNVNSFYEPFPPPCTTVYGFAIFSGQNLEEVLQPSPYTDGIYLWTPASRNAMSRSCWLPRTPLSAVH